MDSQDTIACSDQVRGRSGARLDRVLKPDGHIDVRLQSPRHEAVDPCPPPYMLVFSGTGNHISLTAMVCSLPGMEPLRPPPTHTLTITASASVLYPLCWCAASPA